MVINTSVLESHRNKNEIWGGLIRKCPITFPVCSAEIGRRTFVKTIALAFSRPAKECIRVNIVVGIQFFFSRVGKEENSGLGSYSFRAPDKFRFYD